MKLVERTSKENEAELALSAQANLLGIVRSSFYYYSLPPNQKEVEVKRQVDAIYTDYPFYGSRRISIELDQRGYTVHRHTVQRYMRQMGLEAIVPGQNLSKRHHEHKVYPYLLRKV